MDVSVWRTEGGPHNSHIENSSDFVWYSLIILSKKKGLIEILSYTSGPKMVALETVLSSLLITMLICTANALNAHRTPGTLQ